MRNLGKCSVLFVLCAHAFAAHARTKLAAQDDHDAKSGRLAPLRAGSSFALLPTAASGSSEPDAAVRAISENLRHRGYRVLPPKDVRAKLVSHTPDGCRNPATCDPALALATIGSDAVVSIALWQRPTPPLQLVVHVRRDRGYGQAEVSVRSTSSADVRAAALRALQAALEDSQRTHELWVQIDSEPNGASVHVDQTLTGKTPARFALLPGSHLVSVEAPGFVTRAQYLDLVESSAQETQLTLQLTAADAKHPQAEAPPTREPPPSDARAAIAAHDFAAVPLAAPQPIPQPDSAAEPASPLNYVFAGVLYGVAVPLIVNAIYAAATSGECVGRVDARGACAERVQLGPLFVTSLAAGSVAALGGSAFLIFQPLTSGSNEAPRGVLVRVQRSF